jgi:hypothetical protein
MFFFLSYLLYFSSFFLYSYYFNVCIYRQVFLVPFVILSSLQENRSMSTKTFIAQKSQFRRMMFLATK